MTRRNRTAFGPHRANAPWRSLYPVIVIATPHRPGQVHIQGNVKVTQRPPEVTLSSFTRTAKRFQLAVCVRGIEFGRGDSGGAW